MSDVTYSILDEAHRQRVLARNVTRTGAPLSEQGAMWIISEEGWRMLRVELDSLMYVVTRGSGGSAPIELMGIPVRLTCYDMPDTPMIQLVMEPSIAPRITAKRRDA